MRTRSRRAQGPLFVLLVAGLFQCEPRAPAPAAQSPEAFSPDPAPTNLDAILGPSAPDGGTSPVDFVHAMTVVLCTSSPGACGAQEDDASAEARYKVEFGSGRGSVRSRSQATADLYKELRDRTRAGEHLDAELYSRSDAGAASFAGVKMPTKASRDADPITACAFRLLGFVDGVGEVRIDVIRGAKSEGCQVTLGRRFADAGVSECLIQEPERPKSPARTGISF